MRLARAGDTWKRAIRRNAGTIQLRSLKVTNVRGIGDVTVDFNSPLLAVCGENGAGKTTLLKTLYAALVPEQADAEGIVIRAQNVGIDATALVTVGYLPEGEPAESRRDIASPAEIAELKLGDEESPQVIYLDAAGASQRVRYLVQHDSDFPTALEGAPNAPDDPELLSLRTEITGRPYKAAVCYEIDDYSNEPVFPYFEVTCGQSVYYSEDMGLGELCVNHIVWALERVRKDSIVLLEEPESHLPPRAQEALMTYVAMRSVEKRLTVVVSTHSPHVMARIPNTNVTLLARNGERFIYTPQPPRSVLYETLRIVPARTALAIVEDRSAAALLDGILRAFDELLHERLEIGWVSGHGDIAEIISRKPDGLSKIGLFGVYDGDQRVDKGPGPGHVFLPGDGDPAEYLAETVKASPADYANLFPEHAQALDVALAHCSQADPKDYFHDVKRSIGDVLDIGTLYRGATKLWLLAGTNAEASKKFVAELKQIASPL